MVLWFAVVPGDNGQDSWSFCSLSNEESYGHWRSSWVFQGSEDLIQDPTEGFGDCHPSDDVGLALAFFGCLIEYTESLAIEIKLNEQVLSSICSGAGEGWWDAALRSFTRCHWGVGRSWASHLKAQVRVLSGFAQWLLAEFSSLIPTSKKSFPNSLLNCIALSTEHVIPWHLTGSNKWQHMKGNSKPNLI